MPSPNIVLRETQWTPSFVTQARTWEMGPADELEWSGPGAAICLQQASLYIMERLPHFSFRTTFPANWRVVAMLQKHSSLPKIFLWHINNVEVGRWQDKGSRIVELSAGSLSAVYYLTRTIFSRLGDIRGWGPSYETTWSFVVTGDGWSLRASEM